jgi:hypothetical protein
MIRRAGLSILSCLIWAALLYLGIKVYGSGVQQAVAGYPNNAQLRFYVEFPLAMTLLAAGMAVFAIKLRRLLPTIVSLLQFALILPYLFFYTGGM